jgi:hypothetical protein
MEFLVLGDSLSFGRPKYGICRDKTWPYILKSTLRSEMCFRARGASTSLDVLREARSLADYWFGSMSARLFDFVFVQVGIVDSTPRIIPKKLYPYSLKVPGINVFLRSRRAHCMFGVPWVSSHQFLGNIVSINSLLSKLSNNVFFIEIARPEHYLKENVGDFSGIVGSRNELIHRCIGRDRFVSCWGGLPVPQCLLPDGCHFNELGHQLVAEACLSRIL